MSAFKNITCSLLLASTVLAPLSPLYAGDLPGDIQEQRDGAIRPSFTNLTPIRVVAEAGDQEVEVPLRDLLLKKDSLEDFCTLSAMEKELAEIKSFSEGGPNPLSHAIHTNNLPMVELMLKYRANATECFSYAESLGGRCPILELCLKYGADVSTWHWLILRGKDLGLPEWATMRAVVDLIWISCFDFSWHTCTRETLMVAATVLLVTGILAIKLMSAVVPVLAAAQQALNALPGREWWGVAAAVQYL